ncbi:MAG: hypothetical protein OEX77_11965 [Candidatus Bathyarchaeota archaeon]|nr:hypothetical protein [Candidatus Bathyarchaeota archaeon]MDH5732567.1 hypothetical protein [Candidatus Bathyarchaeota archaeon]
MTKSSNLSKKIFSAETEEIVKDIFVRAGKFKAEAESILSKYKIPLTIEEAGKLIENTFFRFHKVALEIRKRHGERDTLQIKDEYDVQDLLRGLLRMHFDDVRREERTPSFAGKSASIDLFLKQKQIAIETKMTRNGLDEKKLGDELIIDIAHYQKHQKVKFLYCFVYDPKARISNPVGFERDLSRKHEKLDVRVFIMPRT